LPVLSTVNDWSLLLQIETRACREYVKREIVQLERTAASIMRESNFRRNQLKKGESHEPIVQ
jgi:hypothetical protein